MTKKEMINNISEQANVSKNDVDNVLHELTEIIYDALGANDSVSIPGLGKFSTKQRAERMGRNPATGEAMLIPARNAPVFKPAQALRNAVN